MLPVEQSAAPSRRGTLKMSRNVDFEPFSKACDWNAIRMDFFFNLYYFVRMDVCHLYYRHLVYILLKIIFRTTVFYKFQHQNLTGCIYSQSYFRKTIVYKIVGRSMVNTEFCVLQMMTKNVGVIVLAMKISPKAWRARRVNPQSALVLRKSYVPWRHTHYIRVVS